MTSVLLLALAIFAIVAILAAGWADANATERAQRRLVPVPVRVRLRQERIRSRPGRSHPFAAGRHHG